ncbi:EamA family transporter [Brevirhabdus pacifica]|uniref:EamA family transporter n=3 Tax=Brevirhabdus pacifica TaxID=1267768 RepID=A0A1U7DLT4_9RHOB|nr:EamA family transporter [Brevirhabdus pacifica]OWU80307.1 ABC transporter permease [Loktanella sp. 22II-4b]
MSGGDWAVLLFLSLIWGGSFFFVAVAVQELPTLTIVLFRVTVAALVLWTVVALRGAPLPRDPRVWLTFLLLGLVNNAIPFGLIVWGQQVLDSGLASILNATTPLFTVVIAGVFLADERLSLARVLGVLTGFAGVVLMIGFDSLAGLAGHAIAQVAILGAACAYAVSAVLARRFGSLGPDPVVTAAGQVTGAALFLAPAAAVIDRPWQLAVPSAPVWASLLALAVVSTALAYTLYFRLLRRAGATNLVLVTFLVPVTAILMGVLFLDERLAWVHGLGLALIAAGLVAIDGRLLRRGGRQGGGQGGR